MLINIGTPSWKVTKNILYKTKKKTTTTFWLVAYVDIMLMLKFWYYVKMKIINALLCRGACTTLISQSQDVNISQNALLCCGVCETYNKETWQCQNPRGMCNNSLMMFLAGFFSWRASNPTSVTLRENHSLFYFILIFRRSINKRLTMGLKTSLWMVLFYIFPRHF